MFNLKENILLSDLTTIRFGGRAKYYCECNDEEELMECLEFADKEKLKVQVLGGGSNIIFPDNGFEGLVLKIGMKGMSVSGKGGSDETEVTAQAGEDWDNFVMFCAGDGLQGIECLSGIPGKVGATPIQNVGAYGQEVSQTISEISAIERNSLTKVTFSNHECNFGYRQSRFKNEDKDRYIITEVKFKLNRNGEPEIRYKELKEYIDVRLSKEVTPDFTEVTPDSTGKLKIIRNAVIEIRKRKSMIVDSKDPDSVSCGSFFVNPILSKEEFVNFEYLFSENKISYHISDEEIKVSAASLIEKAGFHKGYNKEGAGISSKHTLALINCGGTAKDILNLAVEIEKKVYEKFGIRLRREPVIIN